MRDETEFNVGNVDGALFAKEDGGKYFWGVESYDGIDWEEIREELYAALMK